jgi:hypothetical protein
VEAVINYETNAEGVMIRKIIVTGLHGYASLLGHLADALSPTTDEIWRSRTWKQWDAQRELPAPPGAFKWGFDFLEEEDLDIPVYDAPLDHVVGALSGNPSAGEDVSGCNCGVCQRLAMPKASEETGE